MRQAVAGDQGAGDRQHIRGTGGRQQQPENVRDREHCSQRLSAARAQKQFLDRILNSLVRIISRLSPVVPPPQLADEDGRGDLQGSDDSRECHRC